MPPRVLDTRVPPEYTYGYSGTSRVNVYLPGYPQSISRRVYTLLSTPVTHLLEIVTLPSTTNTTRALRSGLERLEGGAHPLFHPSPRSRTRELIFASSSSRPLNPFCRVDPCCSPSRNTSTLSRTRPTPYPNALLRQTQPARHQPCVTPRHTSFHNRNTPVSTTEYTSFHNRTHQFPQPNTPVSTTETHQFPQSKHTNQPPGSRQTCSVRGPRFDPFLGRLVPLH